METVLNNSDYKASDKSFVVDSTMKKTAYVLILLSLILRTRTFIIGCILMVVSIVYAVLGLLPQYAPVIYFAVIVAVYAVSISYTMRSPKNCDSFITKRYIFDDRGITAAAEGGQATVKWENFRKWKKAAGYYVIYLPNNSFVPVTVSAIPREDLPAFELLLRNKIQRR